VQVKSTWMEKNLKTIFRKNYASSAAPSFQRIHMCISTGTMVYWFYMRLCYTDEPLGKKIFLWLLFFQGMPVTKANSWHLTPLVEESALLS